MRESYYLGDYQNASNELAELDLQSSEKDALLFHLERSSLDTRLGHKASARQHYDKAKRIIDDSFTTRISNTATTFLINESTQMYSGEDYEQVAVHTMAALSWLEDQNLEGARVEAKRVHFRLNQLKDDEHLYHQDGFARFLSALVYEASGDKDDALIDYNKSLEAYSTTYGKFSPHGVPDTLIKSFYHLARKRNRTDYINKLKGRLPQNYKTPTYTSSIVIIHEKGHIAIKRPHEFIFTLDNELIRFSFPYIHKPVWGAPDYQVTKIGNQSFHSELLVDMNALAHTSLEDRRARLMAKGMARIVAKSAMVREARQAFGPIGGAIANLITAATETADTRSWSLLPQKFYINRIWLKPGQHTIKVYSTPSQYKTHTFSLEDYEIKFIRNWE